MASSNRHYQTRQAGSRDVQQHPRNHGDAQELVTEPRDMPQVMESEPMDLDTYSHMQAAEQSMNATSFGSNFRAPERSMSGPVQRGPPVPDKIPQQAMPNTRISVPDKLDARLNDVLDDNMRLKKEKAEAERRAADAESHLANKVAQIARMEVALAQTNRADERDVLIRTLRANERKFIVRDQEKDLVLKRLERKEAEAQEGVSHFKVETQLWMERATRCEADLKKIHEKSIREMTEGRWNPTPDKIIRDRLYALNQDVRDWSKHWATGYLKLDSIPKESKEEFETYLLDFVQPDPAGKLPAGIVFPGVRIREKIPWLLLSSALAFEITDQFFSSPFFCADGKHTQGLEETHAQLLKANPREAHIWRSMMWRMMNPPGADRSSEDNAVFLATQTRVRSLCDRIDAGFRKGPARFLLRSQELEDAKKERARCLREILVKAAGIATLLWVQRPYLKCVGLDALMAKNMSFDVQSPIMQSHPLNKVDLDDHRNNGRKVLLVVRPAILAFEEDDTQGFDGEAYRLLAEAIVFLED